MIDELTTVHKALGEAATEPPGDKPMGTFTFRVNKDELNEANEICNRHGTTIAEFLRSCARALARDYKP